MSELQVKNNVQRPRVRGMDQRILNNGRRKKKADL